MRQHLKMIGPKIIENTGKSPDSPIRYKSHKQHAININNSIEPDRGSEENHNSDLPIRSKETT